MQASLCSINLKRRKALLTDGQVIDITNMFDHDGDETDDPSEALAITAGPDANGKWHSDSVAEYGFSGKPN